MAYRLGVDVGGTFTDLLLINEDTGETFRSKVPTTPGNQAAAVLDGIERVCAIAGIEPAALNELMHGTTIATNARARGKGRTRRPDRHATAIARCCTSPARSSPADSRAGSSGSARPLAALEDTIEVQERIGARGEIVRPLDEASACAALRALAANGVEAITVSLINAFANPAHEHRIRESRGARTAATFRSRSRQNSTRRCASTNAPSRRSPIPTCARRSRATWRISTRECRRRGMTARLRSCCAPTAD